MLTDHRTEAADSKRCETRAGILSAALAACAGRLDHLPLRRDIFERARLSRGTFYKYFDSMEEVLAALGQDLTHLALLEGERFRTVFTEKWKSTSVVLRVVLTRALLDPNWARFVIRTRGLGAGGSAGLGGDPGSGRRPGAGRVPSA